MRLSLSNQRAKFLREVGSVVLGVLIALGIGELAEAVRWKIRVDSSMSAVRTELGGNRFNYAERRANQPCIEQRLVEVGSLLREARKTGMLPDISDFGRPGMRLTEGAAFEVAKSEGVPLHMNRDEARNIAAVYASSEIYRTITDEEAVSWGTLTLLQAAPGPIGDDLLTALLQAWADATNQARFIGVLAQQQDDGLETLGFPIEFDSSEPNRSVMTKRVRGQKLCAPMMVNGKPFKASKTGT